MVVCGPRVGRTSDAGRPDTVITPYRDGPLLVRGAFKLLDQDGNEIELGGRETTTALCRCGKSRLRPFCDGTHNVIRFRGPSGAEHGRGYVEETVSQPAGDAVEADRRAGASAPLLLERAARASSAAHPSRCGDRRQRLHPLAQDVAHRPPLAGLEVGELGVEAVAGGATAVLARSATTRARRASPASCAPPATRRARGRTRPPPRPRAIVVCASHTRSSSVPKRDVRAQLAPPGLRIARPAQHVRERRPGRDRRRHALARQQPADQRPDRREARVAPGVERRVGGERGELGQVPAQRVVDGQRASARAHGDVHLQRADELRAGDVAVLGEDRVVALAGVERAERRARTDARRRRSPAPRRPQPLGERRAARRASSAIAVADASPRAR